MTAFYIWRFIAIQPTCGMVIDRTMFDRRNNDLRRKNA